MKLPLLISCLFFSLNFFAQRYTNSIGLRFANLGFSQLNAKHFMNANNAVEVNLGGNSNFVWMQGNYEWQQNLVDDVDYYVAAGPGFGMYSGNSIVQNTSNNRFMFGLNADIGAEYKLPDYPFTFSFETGPFLRIIPSINLGWNFGLAARYVLP
jgi:hypothetical protein